MQHRFEFVSEPPHVAVTLSGRLALDDWREYLRALEGDARFTPGLAVLTDLTETTDAGELSSDDVRTIGELTRAFDERNGRRPRAVVAPDSLRFGLSRMAQMRADPEGEFSRIFQSRDEAVAWLATQPLR